MLIIFLLTVIIRLWVGDSPMDSFRFPSLSALGECVMLETSGRYEAIQHQAELNPAKQWKWTVRDKKGERFICKG